MSQPHAAFSMFGPSHLGALGVLLLAGSALILQSRSRPNSLSVRACEIALIFVLIVSLTYKSISQLLVGRLDIQSALPFHYCDVAALSGVIALLTHRQRWCELTYFFGLAGTAQALITPSLAFDFPAPVYFVFFAGHGGVVITALYVVLGLKQTPRAGAVKRMMLATTVYALGMGGINALLGTNYGFLCTKPQTASLMDFLGPWPWYIVGVWLLALFVYLLLNLPFRSARPE